MDLERFEDKDEGWKAERKDEEQPVELGDEQLDGWLAEPRLHGWLSLFYSYLRLPTVIVLETRN